MTECSTFAVGITFAKSGSDHSPGAKKNGTLVENLEFPINDHLQLIPNLANPSPVLYLKYI